MVYVYWVCEEVARSYFGQPDVPVEIQSISFNFDLNGQTHAVPLFDLDLDNGFIDSPEWSVDQRISGDYFSRAAYVRSNIDSQIADKFKTIKIKVEVIAKAPVEILEMWAEVNGVKVVESDSGFNGVFHGKISSIFSFENPFRSVGVYDQIWDWKCQLKDSSVMDLGSSMHKFYALNGPPSKPMNTLIYVQVLDSVCSWAHGYTKEEDCLEVVMKRTKQHMVNLEGGSDSQALVDLSMESIKIGFDQIVRNALRNNYYCGEPKRIKPLSSDCFIVSYFVLLSLRSIGVEVDLKILYPTQGRYQNFYTNPVDLIGGVFHFANDESVYDWGHRQYSKHCVIEYNNNWYDPFLNLNGNEDQNRVPFRALYPIGISRCDYLNTLFYSSNRPYCVGCKEDLIDDCINLVNPPAEEIILDGSGESENSSLILSDRDSFEIYQIMDSAGLNNISGYECFVDTPFSGFNFVFHSPGKKEYILINCWIEKRKENWRSDELFVFNSSPIFKTNPDPVLDLGLNLVQIEEYKIGNEYSLIRFYDDVIRIKADTYADSINLKICAIKLLNWVKDKSSGSVGEGFPEIKFFKNDTSDLKPGYSTSQIRLQDRLLLDSPSREFLVVDYLCSKGNIIISDSKMYYIPVEVGKVNFLITLFKRNSFEIKVVEYEIEVID